MKRNSLSVLLGLTIIITLCMGCANKDDIANLQAQIDEIKSANIATIEQQISRINTTLVTLQVSDTELQGYIETLQRQREVLVQADEKFSADIAKLSSDLTSTQDAINDVLAQLNAYKKIVSGQINNLDLAIKALQTKEEELQAQISNLKAYVDFGIQGAKDWASATFATLTEYDKTAGIVAAIQGQINTITAQIEDLYASVAGVTKKDLEDAISRLDSSLQEKISEAVDTCNLAISNASEEITAAYTKAISNAISISEASMRSWVNTQLTEYYTIAQTDATLSATKASLESQLAGQKTYLESLIKTLDGQVSENTENIEELLEDISTAHSKIDELSESLAKVTDEMKAGLASAKTEITEAYNKAISAAISTLDGKLSGQIATEVATINSRIDEEVKTINETVESLAGRVAACEKDIKSIKNAIYSIQQDIEDIQEQIQDILARIQTITYVPEYSDGKAIMTYTNNGVITAGTAEFTFEMKPSATASELVKVWQDAVSMQAVYTITKTAPEMVELTVESVTADGGFLTVTVSGNALKDEYFLNQCSTNVRLSISDGNNDITTDYIQMVPWSTDIISFGDVIFKTYCVENFDTSGDGELSEEEAQAVTSINASMLNITSLVGIEYFSNLESIDVSFNKLTSLDLSHSLKLKNIDVSGNKLQELNIEGLSEITSLDCSNNKLGTLDISSAAEIKTLCCNNNELGVLLLSNNKAITELQCNNNNLASLNLKNNTKLETLYCRKNALSTIDVTRMLNLKNFDCSANSISSLNLYQNHALGVLHCSSNNLANIGITSNTMLSVLDCSKNLLTSLDVSKNILLETIICSNNELERLDVSRNYVLESVACEGNLSLAKLWVKNASQQAALTIKKDDFTMIAFSDGGINIPDTCLKNYLLSLFDDDKDGEISPFEAENILDINCSGRSITDLTGLENCSCLKYLNFSGNNVSIVNLPDLRNLETIIAYGNPVKKLNVDNDVALSKLFLQSANVNALSGTTMTIDAYDQASTLYLAFAGTGYTCLNLTNSNTLTSFNVSENIQLEKLNASGNVLVAEVDLAKLTELSKLDLSTCALTSLNVGSNTKLVDFNCSGNKLTALSILNNTLLEKVDASSNLLESLNVLKNKGIKELNISENFGITAIDLANNRDLESFAASNTAITSVYLSANTDLAKLNLSGCEKLTLIDLSANVKLTDLNVSGTSLATLDLSNNDLLSSLEIVDTPLKSSFQIGDVFDTGGEEGVVFAIGDEVKLVSTDETRTEWGYYGTKIGTGSDAKSNTDKIESGSPAASWCRKKGASWYLPSTDELKEMIQKRTVIDNTIKNIGGAYVYDGENYEFKCWWSSKEYSSDDVNYISYYGPRNEISTYHMAKKDCNYVRAVISF